MKQFAKKTAIYILSALLISLGICFVDIPTFYKYYYTLNEGCSNMYVYDRLFENKKPIDIVFLGTSHTGCGINAKMIEDSLPGINIANLAYCQLGENLQYVLLKQIIEKHKPTKLYYEVRLIRDFTSHRDFGALAEPIDLFSAPIVHNTHFIGDLLKAYKVRYMYFQDRLQDVLPENSRKFSDHDEFNDWGIRLDESTAENHLNYQRSRLVKMKDDMSGSWDLQFPNYYIEKTLKLAAENGIEVEFLYIPNFGMVREVPADIAFLKKHANVIIPPVELFRDRSLWMDSEHFNQSGADQLTNYLIKQMRLKETHLN